MALRDHVIQVGQVLDKYELLERVGQGGMAVVYRAIDRQLKRRLDETMAACPLRPAPG